MMNKRLMVLWQEKIKMLITKVQKKHKNITGLKVWPTFSDKRKLREVVRKRRKVPLYPYFHPSGSELWEYFLAQWVFALKFQLFEKNMVGSLFELKREFYIEFGALLMTGFWVVKEAFISHDTNLVFWLRLLLFREEFSMILEIK